MWLAVFQFQTFLYTSQSSIHFWMLGIAKNESRHNSKHCKSLILLIRPFQCPKNENFKIYNVALFTIFFFIYLKIHVLLCDKDDCFDLSFKKMPLTENLCWEIIVIMLCLHLRANRAVSHKVLLDNQKCMTNAKIVPRFHKLLNLKFY